MGFESLSTLKIQMLFFYDAGVMMGSLTLIPFSGHWSISQHWSVRFHTERCAFRFSVLPVPGLLAETANKWLLNTCQAAVTFSPQFIIMQNRYSAVNPWFIIMQNQCSVAGNALFIMGHVQITWMWICGDAHQLICQKLPHKGAIHHTGNI